MARVAVVLARDFADWEYALIAGTGGPYYGLDVEYFTPEPGEVHSQGGLAAVVSRNMDEISGWQPDAVAVIGSAVWQTGQAPDIAAMLKAQHSAGTVVAGICGATLALARAGLLNDVPHTSNNADFLTQNVPGYAGSKLYQPTPSAVSHDRVITAPGTAPVSFTAAVFESVGLAQDTVLQFKQMMAAEHA